MLESGQALLTAHAAVVKQFPDRQIANVVVEPGPDQYQVLLVELPKPGDAKKVTDAWEVQVDRQAGTVVAVKETPLQTSPYSSPPAKGVSLTGKEAYEAAVAALRGYETYGKDGRLTVALVDATYWVTFPLPSGPKPSRGADYAFQIWIDASTGKVIKVLVAS